MRAKPPADVIGAFGATGEMYALGGGQGTSWRVGDLVLKPVDLALEELEWQAGLFSSVRCDGFRLSAPRRARNGLLIVSNWCAREHLEGQHEPRRWESIIAVGERFHAAIADVPRPAIIDAGKDRWAIGDRVAWGDLPIEDFLHVKHVPRLARALRPIVATSQLVHGDLTGNVLFAAGLPPAIIDFSPYWRPTAFASAVVVADALVWEGADASLLRAVGQIDRFEQFLLRALIYRAVSDQLFRDREPIRPDSEDPFLPAVELAAQLAGSS
jgi:uncharacterized protein (TIGR02569 family)